MLMQGRILVLYFVSDEMLLKNSFYTPILDGIRVQAKKDSFELYYISLCNLQERELEETIQRSAAKVNGFIFLGMRPAYVPPLTTLLNQLDMPTVVMTTEYRIDYAKADYITPDNIAAVKNAITFLVGHNHKRIAFFKHRRDDLGFNNVVIAEDVSARLQGYKEGLQENGIPYDEDLVIELHYSSESKIKTNGFGAVTVPNIELEDIKPVFALLAKPNKPTAVFCANDVLAFYILKMAEHTHLNIPEQLTVMGFDGIYETSAIKPPLTTIQTPLEYMGNRAIARLKERIQKENTLAGIDITLPSAIVGRASHRTL